MSIKITDVTTEIEEKRNLSSHTGAALQSETGWMIEGRAYEDEEEELEMDVLSSILDCVEISGLEALKA